MEHSISSLRSLNIKMNLIQSYKDKLHLLKSLPSEHVKNVITATYNEENAFAKDKLKSCYNFCIHKIFIPNVYNKPNTYSNETGSNKINLEIFEEVDKCKFNFTQKDDKETLMAIINDDRSKEKIILCRENEEEIIQKIYKKSDVDLRENNNYSYNYTLNMDLVVMNIFPIVNMHLLILPFYTKILPQFLNDNLILERIFKFQKIVNEKDLM